MRIISFCILLLAGAAVGLAAYQDQPGPAPRDADFYAGRWEVAVGQHPTNGPFDRVLELRVSGAKLTGTLTTGSRTVGVVGELDKGFYLRTEASTDPSPQVEVETFVGAAWDGTLLHGTYFRSIGDSTRKTGWAARRPTLPK